MSGNTPEPGVHLLEDGSGALFVVRSRSASAIDLCLFDGPDQPHESRRARFTHREGDVWWVTVPGVTAGQVYGLRVHGGWDPGAGRYFNGNKLLLDPFARAVVGSVDWHVSMQGPREKDRLRPDTTDSAPHMMRGVVAPAGDGFDWEGVSSPGHAWTDTVIYELHVKGFTNLHPDIPEELRGTYAGLAHPAALDYLVDLGVTAVQLMPVHTHLNDGFLLEKNLTNYWGYNTLNFFTPHPEYAASSDPLEQVAEFKRMVRALHRAGIEVILDVVYNHTAEGDAAGPLLSFKGLDAGAWYRLDPEEATDFIDVTGCGHSVNCYHSHAHQLILSSLRYWVEEMHVDGFRFDLATTLGRTIDNFDPRAPFFQSIAQDPVLSRCKMIAEPWDIGWGGYQVGKFPQGWSELNGRFRDALRGFWRGNSGTASESATRLAGSSDLFFGRGPSASVNFITSHDGFTLRDLVSYNEKHNLENGEDNRDGDSHNLSQNFGVEGETEQEAIRAIRLRLQRSMMATVVLANGVPFILAGDERNRTQRGNNNSYCQDNTLSWIDWGGDRDAEDLHGALKLLLEIRRTHPVFHRQRFFTGRLDPTSNVRDLAWFGPDGVSMTHERWHATETRAFAAVLAGGVRMLPPTRIDGPDQQAPCLLLMLNASDDPQRFVLPGDQDVRWRCLFDSSFERGIPENTELVSGMTIQRVLDRGFAVWEQGAGSRAGAQCGMPAAHPPAPPPAAAAGSDREESRSDPSS